MKIPSIFSIFVSSRVWPIFFSFFTIMLTNNVTASYYESISPAPAPAPSVTHDLQEARVYSLLQTGRCNDNYYIYNTSHQYCNWRGITCNHAGHIIEISLHTLNYGIMYSHHVFRERKNIQQSQLVLPFKFSSSKSFWSRSRGHHSSGDR